MNAPQATEFVYSWFVFEDNNFQDKWIAHRILKRTEKWVYIAHKIGRSEYTVKLRRAELEEKGQVWSSPAREHFYTETGKAAFDKERASWYGRVPLCLQAFGLSKDATADDVKRAYHEAALKEHPDTGGTHEWFLKLQEHYKSALRMVQR
jgi:hypothetical protein